MWKGSVEKEEGTLYFLSQNRRGKRTQFTHPVYPAMCLLYGIYLGKFA
jgi:hypothetical protein